MITSVALLAISAAIASPPVQQPVATVLGPKAYREGDVVEILEVTSTSPRLEHGDSVTVKGRVHLQSRERADLCLFLTQTGASGAVPVDPAQRMVVSRGRSDFELRTTIRNRGVLHVTFYDPASGQPIGGTYFGTAEQMQAIAGWDVGYYLTD